MVVGQGQGGGASCETALWDNGTGEDNADVDINDQKETVYVGQIIQDSTTRNICKVSIWVTKKAGTITSYNYQAGFVAASSSYDFTPGSITFADATVAGSQSWAAPGAGGTEISFTWATPFELTANTRFAFVLTHDGATSADNYAELEYLADGVIPGGSVYYWDVNGSDQGGVAGDIKAIFYTN